jgi:acyl-CoA reductase-like NAD-dependent aldehyde dehydrogenase/nicotinamidase-related amidase
MKPVLLLVDLQNDFLRPGGLEPHPAGVVTAAANLLNACRTGAVPVVHVWTTVNKSVDNRMPHRKKNDDWMCLEGSDGHACPNSLQPHKKETIIHKTFFSAFSTGQLDLVLHELKADALIIAGLHLHACIRATALDAYAKGYRVVIVEDSTASNDLIHAAITKRYLQERSVIFRSSGEILAAIAVSPAKVGELLVDKQPETVAHTSPQNFKRTWKVAVSRKSDIDAVTATARKTFQQWRRVRVNERLGLLQEFGRNLEQDKDQLVDLLVEDIGKPVRYARNEVSRALALIDVTAKQVEPEQDYRMEKTGFRREPLGVVALISPFNNPLSIPVGKIVPALLYGNVVVWKPAIPGSRIAQRTTELFSLATGWPKLLQVLCGGVQTARELMHASDAVTISGSLKAGRSAQEICGAYHIPLQAELGGNNASIVWRDADLQAAAASIAEGAFAFAGQRCTANRRAIIDSSIYDAFLDQLIMASRGLVCGDPTDEKTQIGPLISFASRDRVKAVVVRAQAAMLQVIRPAGELDGARGGSWLEPAIVCCDDPGAEIVQEETFGPVLVVQKAKDWDEAISLCNGVKQGLAAAVFTTAQERIEDFLRRVHTGVLKVNRSTADAAVDLPFGGWKASGVGPPEHGPANREFFTRMQALYFAEA